MITWGIARVVALQAWASVLWAWGTSVGRIATIAVMAIGGFVGWSAWERHVGRDQERAANAALTRQAEAAAQSEHDEIRAERDAAASRDEKELAALAVESKGVRDAATDGDVVFWRADDVWLRSKLAAAGRR